MTSHSQPHHPSSNFVYSVQVIMVVRVSSGVLCFPFLVLVLVVLVFPCLCMCVFVCVGVSLLAPLPTYTPVPACHQHTCLLSTYHVPVKEPGIPRPGLIVTLVPVVVKSLTERFNILYSLLFVLTFSFCCRVIFPSLPAHLSLLQQLFSLCHTASLCSLCLVLNKDLI